jgi:hypothetical protein
MFNLSKEHIKADVVMSDSDFAAGAIFGLALIFFIVLISWFLFSIADSWSTSIAVKASITYLLIFLLLILHATATSFTPGTWDTLINHLLFVLYLFLGCAVPYALVVWLVGRKG